MTARAGWGPGQLSAGAGDAWDRGRGEDGPGHRHPFGPCPETPQARFRGTVSFQVREKTRRPSS